MMKKLRLTFLFQFLVISLIAQNALKVSPLNPAYEKFIEAYENGGTDATASPSPIQPGFKQYAKAKEHKAPAVFPMVYDMRTAGLAGTSLLTPVKHQLSCGDCWSFASCSSIESVWKVQGLGDTDLSENNLKNCHGFVPDPCIWGHHFMTTAYLVRGSGPIAEADDPYDPDDPNCTPALTPQAYIPESWYLPDDPEAFKNIIMNYGAVYNTYRSESADYTWINGHLTYCYQGDLSTTHAIAIVGWNDTLTTACGNGAWICKNEYGEGFGEDGFFYISYQDSLVLKYNAIWPVREKYNPDQYIYQYDSLGGWPSAGYEDSIAYGLIKFNVDKNQFFTRIGTYTVAYGSKLEVDIYDDFDGTNLSNLLMNIPETYIEFPGFHTLNLPSPLRQNAGDDLYIQIKYNSPGEDYPIAIESFSDGYTLPIIETGKCWSRADTGTWEPWGAGTANEFDMCIKAYAFPVMQLNVRACLEGAFNGLDMDTLLHGMLPQNQPYSQSPWNYPGIESLTTNTPAGLVDWILVELRETPGDVMSATNDRVIARQACLLRKDGQLINTSGDSLLEFNVNCPDSLFVVMYHRNHLPLMSAHALIKTNGVYTIDFTSSASKALNASQKELKPGMFGMISGNAFADSLIDEQDKTVFWNLLTGRKGYLKADFNLDQQVDNADKNDYLIPNLEQSVQIPQ